MRKPTGPMPPCSTGVLRQAKWVNWESMDTPTISTPRSRNSLRRLSWAMISVGQTKVKSRGQKKRTTYFPRREERVKSSTFPPGVTEGAVKSGACLVTSTLMIFSLCR